MEGLKYHHQAFVEKFKFKLRISTGFITVATLGGLLINVMHSFGLFMNRNFDLKSLDFTFYDA